MKVSTWIPKHSPLPRTLADVPSSRENPVPCWLSDGSLVAQLWSSGDTVYRVDREGVSAELCYPPERYELYSAPTRPTKLEDVPDRRVIRCTLDGERMEDDTVYAFRESGVWLGLDGNPAPCTSNRWRLTDHVAELVETEIGVVE